MPNLASIEVEVLALIFEFIVDTSPRSIASLALVNKQLYATSRLVAHRRKTLEYVWGTGHSSTTEIEGWLQDPVVLRGLRHLTIESRGGTLEEDGPEYDSTDAKFKELRDLLENLGHLQTLVWNHDTMIPLSIIEALHKYQPKAELQIYNFQRDVQEEDENNPAEVALAHSPALTAIKASFGSNGGHPDLRDACFKRIVANAPNLRFASLSRWASGCVIHGLTSEQMSDRAEKEKKFYTHLKPNDSLRRLTLDGFGMSKALLEEWSEFVDLSKLENIKVSAGHPHISYFTYAPQVLTNLKHVSLNLSYLASDGGGDAAVIEDYLTTCAPLQSLSLWSWMGKISLDNILAKHGQTLDTLQLHERETVNPDQRRKVLSAANIRAIRLACPNLRDFTLDCDRPNETLDTELSSDNVLTELKEMKLARLQIYYDLGIARMTATRTPGFMDESDEDDDSDSEDNDDGDDDGDDDETNAATSDRVASPLKPSQTSNIEGYVQRLWTFIFGSQQIAANTTARELEVKFGEWERRMPNGYPAPWIVEETQSRTRWVLKPHDRDDKQGECVVAKYGNQFSDGR